MQWGTKYTINCGEKSTYSVSYIENKLGDTSVIRFVYLFQRIFVPRSLEALVPVWGHVGPEPPQTVQLLHLPGRGLPGVEHAGVQRTPAHQHSKQTQQTKHPARVSYNYID